MFALPIAEGGIVPPSRAAVITSAGKSICTPSGYAYASSGEYAGGSGSGVVALSVVAPDPAVDEVDDEASACRWISRTSGVGGSGSGLIGESGGGCTWIASGTSEPPEDDEPPRVCVIVECCEWWRR